ncbi:MAG: hypothetical protein MZW92_46615 [Comamonadaceae bacterium]|nr:hypothetical protein [Comamonadaceae bacterium]
MRVGGETPIAVRPAADLRHQPRPARTMVASGHVPRGSVLPHQRHPASAIPPLRERTEDILVAGAAVPRRVRRRARRSAARSERRAPSRRCWTTPGPATSASCSHCHRARLHPLVRPHAGAAATSSRPDLRRDSAASRLPAISADYLQECERSYIRRRAREPRLAAWRAPRRAWASAARRCGRRRASSASRRRRARDQG